MNSIQLPIPDHLLAARLACDENGAWTEVCVEADGTETQIPLEETK